MNKPVQSTAKAKALKPTPMMAQYLGIKQEAGAEVILFYRMGDFYEMFFDDAVQAAAALDIALTKRGKHGDQDIPMCGVPVHAETASVYKNARTGMGSLASRFASKPKARLKLKSAAINRWSAAKSSALSLPEP